VFKNFKWKYGVAAACPQCGEFAYNWQEVEARKKGGV